MMEREHITGIILAGGKSSRMGTDKGLLKFQGKHLVEYSITALKPFVSEIMIVSNNSAYDNFDYKRVKDYLENQGPVAGIYSGLVETKTENNIVLSCDIPFVTSEVIQKLIKNMDVDSEIIQIENQGKTMPLIAVYKKSVANKFKKILQTDERRLRVAVQSCNYKNVSIKKELEKTTMNVNTREDFKLIENADYY